MRKKRVLIRESAINANENNDYKSRRHQHLIHRRSHSTRTTNKRRFNPKSRNAFQPIQQKRIKMLLEAHFQTARVECETITSG